MSKATVESLQLEEMLEEPWLGALQDVICSRKQIESVLAPSRPAAVIPARPTTFAALRGVHPADFRVVVFGQDPYPREESAVGVAFNDGKIKKWTDPTSPSFRNIVKGVLIHRGWVEKSAKVAELRKQLKKHAVIPPPDWFEYLIRKEGVCWLNTSLTFESKEKTDLDRHTAVWKPVVMEIVRSIIKFKEEAKAAEKKVLCFVLWGGYAKKLRAPIQKMVDKEGQSVQVRFVTANHPAVESFHAGTNTFAAIDSFFEEHGLRKIQWTPTAEQAANKDINDRAVKRKKVTSFFKKKGDGVNNNNNNNSNNNDSEE